MNNDTASIGLDKDARSYRLTSIDFLRGLVIVIMAIDHSRDFFMTGGAVDPFASSDVPLPLYLTRWITHFCAPVFVFLAGTSAGLMSYRKSKNELGGFLLKRGIWLIIVEMLLITPIVTFFGRGMDQVPGILIIFQVIWAIGASMVVLSFVQYLGSKSTLIIGLIIIFGHNLLGYIWPVAEGVSPFWFSLYTQSLTVIGPLSIMTIYPLIPWIGVILVGFGSSFIFKLEPEKRKSYLLKAGFIMIVSFVVLRALDFYGEANHWEMQEMGLIATILDIMNVSKYPPSLLFLLITLGPMAILCAYTDQFNGWFKDVMIMFGRVPFFFYVIHFALLHLLSIIFGMLQGFEASQLATGFFNYPKGYGTSLLGVYLVWILVVLSLYLPSKWMAKVKRERKDWWLSYL